MSWTCALCNRSFQRTGQIHYCGDQSVAGLLNNKSAVAIQLFDHLIAKFTEIGPLHVYETKSMVVLAHEKGFAYVINIGLHFIDVVFPFKESFNDNLCFRKIAPVPGSDDYNHHLRLMFTEDINDEVFDYMKKVYALGKNI